MEFFMFALLASLLLAASPQAGADPVIGTWVNPKGTVTVRTARCGRAICGTVISAAPSAQEKARAAGTARLVGTRIMSDFRPAGAGTWQGQAFIPDLGVTVPATMTQLGRDRLQIEGCGMGGYLCKQQVWTRVAVRPKRR
jgi:uncharacterized protein (DUF2147 family)